MSDPDPELRAKVGRIAKLEQFYRISPFWRILLVKIVLYLFSPNEPHPSKSIGPVTEWLSQSSGDIGPITAWLFTRELVRSCMAFVPFEWAGPFTFAPFVYSMWLTHQLELATKPAVPLSQALLWRVSTWLCVNKILLVLELLSELVCIFLFYEGGSEGGTVIKPLSSPFLRVEIGVSMLYLLYRFVSLRLVARYVKELEQERLVARFLKELQLQQEQNSSRFQPTQIQEQSPNPVPLKETSIAIAIPD